MEWQQAMDAPTWGVGVVSPTAVGPASPATSARSNKRPASVDLAPAPGGPEDSYYIKGLTNPLRATLRAEGKCFLCKQKTTPKHSVSDCPNRQDMYNRGEYFAFPKTWRNMG